MTPGRSPVSRGPLWTRSPRFEHPRRCRRGPAPGRLRRTPKPGPRQLVCHSLPPGPHSHPQLGRLVDALSAVYQPEPGQLRVPDGRRRPSPQARPTLFRQPQVSNRRVGARPLGGAVPAASQARPHAALARARAPDRLSLGRATSSSRGVSLVLPPRPGWRDLTGRCWHARPSAASAPPTNSAPELSPLGSLIQSGRLRWLRCLPLVALEQAMVFTVPRFQGQGRPSGQPTGRGTP
jgi:hypothetical protein